MLRLFRKIVTPDKDLNTVQDSIGSVLNQVTKLPILDGVLLTGLKITTSAQKFNHTLNRTPLGYFIVAKILPGDVYSPSSTATTITLQSTTDIVVNLWIF